MKRVEAPTLEEAYQKAASLLGCSIATLEYEVIQYPSKGFLGLGQKRAIIVAVAQREEGGVSTTATQPSTPPSPSNPREDRDTSHEDTKREAVQEEKRVVTTSSVSVNAVVDSFFEKETAKEEKLSSQELAQLIEDQIKVMLGHLCFAIDVVEVDVRDNTALIFIDGEDAALLIGKEGYRYNALSYMLFNWLHSKYQLFIKLEIAEFLTKQQEMIASYIQPVIESVERTGKGRTHFLDGILVQIALEQLRERFPDKYIAIKTTKDGKKFVVINAFNTPNKNR
jgi:spoIIIJ-associated protein